MTFTEAMDLLARGFEVKRACWETWIFGPMHPCINEPHDGSMWFWLPEELKPSVIGSQYEDDRYKPTKIDKTATDWEAEA